MKADDRWGRAKAGGSLPPGARIAVHVAALLLLLVRALAERIEPGFGTAAAVTLAGGKKVDGTVTEEPVHVVNASVDPHAVQKYLFGQSPATVDYECPAGA